MSSQVDSYNIPYDFYPFRVGNFECLALCAGGAQYTLESMVTNAPRSEVQAYLQAHGLPTEFIATPYTYLFVNTGKHKVLVDMGAGNLFPTTGRLLQSMEKAGLSSQSIERIFISHAHPDHVGEALDDNGKLIFRMLRISFGRTNGISGSPIRPLTRWAKYSLHLPGKSWSHSRIRSSYYRKKKKSCQV